MLCLNCKYAYKHYREIPREELQKMLQGISYEEFSSLMDSMYNDVSRFFKIVLFCRKKLTWVVGNPDKPTQQVKRCEFFEIK